MAPRRWCLLYICPFFINVLPLVEAVNVKDGHDKPKATTGTIAAGTPAGRGLKGVSSISMEISAAGHAIPGQRSTSLLRSEAPQQVVQLHPQQDATQLKEEDTVLLRSQAIEEQQQLQKEKAGDFKKDLGEKQLQKEKAEDLKEDLKELQLQTKEKAEDLKEDLKEKYLTKEKAEDLQEDLKELQLQKEKAEDLKEDLKELQKQHQQRTMQGTESSEDQSKEVDGRPYYSQSSSYGGDVRRITSPQVANPYGSGYVQKPRYGQRPAVRPSQPYVVSSSPYGSSSGSPYGSSSGSTYGSSSGSPYGSSASANYGGRPAASPAVDGPPGSRGSYGSPVTSSLPTSGCIIPQWSKEDFVCAEHSTVSSSNIFVDSNGLSQKKLKYDDSCTVKCPNGRWWQAPSELSLVCGKTSRLQTKQGKAITGLRCATATWFYCVLVMSALLCTSGAASYYYYYVLPKSPGAEAGQTNDALVSGQEQTGEEAQAATTQ
eukprot:TRINITY_DN1824_c0_g1_i2.p1 TRINITY_DN1824_c0_g1~~TRINITY_DN1824_c0_g1_i2.p1  ORF type:complete len:487 (-),score=111.21 TRINITY_DN1824_c0_g1_i2:159-1619(-)